MKSRKKFFEFFSEIFFEKVEILEISTKNRNFGFSDFFIRFFKKLKKINFDFSFQQTKCLSKKNSIDFFQNNIFHQAAPIQGASRAPRSDMATLRRKGNPGISQIWGQNHRFSEKFRFLGANSQQLRDLL